MRKILYTFLTILLSQLINTAVPIKVLFIISGQYGSDYHRQLSANLRNNILQQSQTLGRDYTVDVFLLHEIFNHPGDWTLLPVLARLSDAPSHHLSDDTNWIILCEESTSVALQPLLQKLSKENHSEPLFLGFPLHDQEATIIHHFAFFENPKWFLYPMLRAGVVFTPSLLKSLAAAVSRENNAVGIKSQTRTTEFSIDAAHELARFIIDNVHIGADEHLEDTAIDSAIDGVGVVATEAEGHERNSGEKILSHSGAAAAAADADAVAVAGRVKHLKKFRKMILQRASYICPKATAENAAVMLAKNAVGMQQGKGIAACGMFAKPMDSTSCHSIQREQIFFAIKTCHKFHEERIRIIEATWAPYVVHKRYYSDVAEAEIPTESTGIPNVDTGHCMKTLAILNLALKDIEQINQKLMALQPNTGDGSSVDNSIIRWLFLCDDDTLLSVSHLRDLLGCFNHSDMVYLGERYGYRLHAEDGFNYITGGGGIVFSLPLVKLILKHCTCPTAASPDDMILGACLHMLGIKAIHVPRFHQARPSDYPRELLRLDPPISFHKFWQLDPVHVYEQWFAAADRHMLTLEFLQQQSLHRRKKLQKRLKLMATLSNKSRYCFDSNHNCYNNHRIINNIGPNIEASHQWPFSLESAFDSETSSRLDL